MERVWTYVDMHSHIIPGVDDGASDFEEAVRMAEQAYREGIRIILCTPHYGAKNSHLDNRKAADNMRKLASLVRVMHSDMMLLEGNEILYSPGIMRDIRLGRTRTLAGTKYALVEFRSDDPYSRITECMYECNNEGYIPLIAHVERYRCLREAPGRVQELRDRGAIIQVNSSNLLQDASSRTTNKREANEFATALLRDGAVDIIATDMHNSTTRSPLMETVVSQLIPIVGVEEMHRIISANPRKILTHTGE